MLNSKQVDSADLLWVLIATILVWITVPGTGLYYSGMTKRKNALSLLWLSLMCVCVTSIQWFSIGYSLVFSQSQSRFIGNFANIFMIGILNQSILPGTTIPPIAFCFFELMFAATATTIVSGAVSERGRIWPTIVFTFLWCTFVYNFVSYWIWSANGWAHHMGSLDHAGGVPIHIAAGTSSLAYSLILGKRQSSPNSQQNKPHNINNIFIGTVLSWFGWFGFNGGSGLVISLRTIFVCISTNLSACVGGLTWCLLDYHLANPRYKFTLVGFCMGSMAGLVCVTPASGYINTPAAILFGIIGSTCVYFGRKIKHICRIDDPFDIFAQHGIGGFVGCLLTGIFAQKSIAELDSIDIPGGWLDGHFMQIIYQLLFAMAAFIWSFLVTIIILLVVNIIPGLSLRTSINGEIEGIDYDQFNEYTHDYIELQRELRISLPMVTRENLAQKQQKTKNIILTKVEPICTISNRY